MLLLERPENKLFSFGEQSSKNKNVHNNNIFQEKSEKFFNVKNIGNK